MNEITTDFCTTSASSSYAVQLRRCISRICAVIRLFMIAALRCNAMDDLLSVQRRALPTAF